MADVSIDATVSTSSARGTRSVVFTTASIGYWFYIDSAGTFVYSKTSNGGVSWGAAVTINSNTDIVAFDVWFDQWTPGDSGTLIHTWYFSVTGTNPDSALWRSLNTSGDTLGTQRVVFTGASAVAGRGAFISGTKTRSGYLYCAYDLDAGAEKGLHRSIDSGTTWSASLSATFVEATLDTCKLYPASKDIVASYSEANYSANATLFRTTGAIIRAAQSFAGQAQDLYQARFYPYKVGSPPGNIRAHLYAHSGTYGTNSVPTGSPLATSDDISAATLGTTPSLVTFTFSTPYTMAAGTNYCIAFEYSDWVDNANYVALGLDDTTPTATGNKAHLVGSTWTSDSAVDYIFYVIGSGDTNDCWALYYDASATALTLKLWDSSAASATESATIQTHTDGATDLTGQFGFDASVRHSDGHLIMATLTQRDVAASAHQVYDITDTSTITTKTAIQASTDDHYYPQVFIDQNTNAIYVSYNGKRDGSEVMDTTTKVYYTKSTDGGSTWSSGDTAYMEGAAGVVQQVWTPISGPRFYAGWRVAGTLVGNAVNSVNVTPSAAARRVFIMSA